MRNGRSEWIEAQQAASRAFSCGEFAGASAWERRQVALLEDLVELVAAIAEKLEIPVPELSDESLTVRARGPAMRSRWHKLFHPRG